MSESTPALEVAERIRADVESLPPPARPACLARLERRGAQRYRDWADQTSNAVLAAALRVCAAREDGIADLIEAVFPAPRESAPALDEVLARIGAKLAAHNTSATLPARLAAQAALERAGSLSWSEFKDLTVTAEQRWTLDLCARLESESAEFLESAVTQLERRGPGGDDVRS